MTYSKNRETQYRPGAVRQRGGAWLCSLFLLLLLVACGQDAPVDETVGPRATAQVSDPVDLPEIEARGKLIGLTAYGATNYFIYKGRPMGYEYELLSLLAEELGVDLEIVLVRDIDHILEDLNSGGGDIVAAGLAVTKERLRDVEFTDEYNLMRQVLVQRKPSNWRKMKLHEIEKVLIRNQTDLIGKHVYVRKESSYYSRLQSLSEEIGGDILIEEVSGEINTEELIRMVADGEIDYTIADENIALVGERFAPILDVATPVSFPQRIAWAVRKDSPVLRARVNEWLGKVIKDGTKNMLYEKYFKRPRDFKESMKSHFQDSVEGERISEFDGLIQQYARAIGWDWRLVASQVYQESRFNPKAKSWAGAVGLMQLMPRTGKAHGAKDLRDPEENLKAGTAFIEWLDDQWTNIVEPDQRIKFVLASFNAGKGHIEDAQRLTKKHGGDPTQWDGNVVQYVIALSQKEFFNDDDVKFGYCQGERVAAYVREILERYTHYKNFIGLRPKPLVTKRNAG